MIQTSSSSDTAAAPAGMPELSTAAFGAELLSKMGHQLRSPLTGITGLTRIMLVKARTGRADPTKLIQQLEMIETGAQRSMVTVERVLDAARIELAATHAQPRPTDLCRLVIEAAAAPRAIAEERAITLCVDVPRRPVTVTTDPDALSWLLRELIDNAVIFTDGDEVRLDLRARETGYGSGRTAIEVSDDGPGIAESDHRRIFEPFERARRTGRSVPETVGMGLYLARQMADRLGATLSMSSRPGSGSTFTVAFDDGEPRRNAGPGHRSED
jgi:signal transduction histidine kinase